MTQARDTNGVVNRVAIFRWSIVTRTVKMGQQFWYVGAVLWRKEIARDKRLVVKYGRATVNVLIW